MSTAFGVEAKPILKIGVVLPLTGNNAALGEDVKNGIGLALEELKKENRPVDLKVIYEDDQMEGRLTNSAALKLIQLDKVDVIVSLWTPAANIISHHTDREKVIHFNTSWDPTAAQKFHWTLVHGPSIASFAAKSVEVMKLHHAKRIAIASVVQMGNQKIIAAARPLMKEAGLEVVFDEQFAPGNRDLRVYVLKIRESKPDFVWELFFEPEDEIFFRATQQIGYKPIGTGYYDYITANSKKYVDGAIFPALMTTPTYNQKYIATYKVAPKYMETGACYDIVRMVSQTANELYEKTRQMPTRASLLKELKKPRSFENLSIGQATMNPDGWLESHFSLYQMKDEQIISYLPKN